MLRKLSDISALTEMQKKSKLKSAITPTLQMIHQL